MFDHNIYCFTFTNIHLQVCLKARIQTRICARTVKVNVILHCFNTTRVTHLNIECLQITYLDSSLGFSSFLCNSDSSPLDLPPCSLPSSKSSPKPQLHCISSASHRTPVSQIEIARNWLSERAPKITFDNSEGKVSAQPHTIVKQICFPNGNVLFLSLFLYSRTECIM